MSLLKNKIVMITGASSGIGEASAKLFAKLGAKLLLCARRKDRLDDLASMLSKEYGAEVYPIQMNVSDRQHVEKVWADLAQRWQAVDVLINSAGLALAMDTLYEGDPVDWETMIDTNIKGVLYVTRKVMQNMIQRECGHIINIGSISSCQVYPGGAVYCATKFAINAISEGIKMDSHGHGLRVSQINPGMVETEFSAVRFSLDQDKANKVYQGLQPLTAEDVADAIVYCATRPAHVDVREINIFPTAQTAAHMVDRRL